MKNAVQVEKLGKYYAQGNSRGKWGLRDVSFSLAPGDFLGVVGHNGSGKSTLLKILSGILWPTEGKATIRGRHAAILDIGSGFHPDLSGRENLYLVGSLYGLSRQEMARREAEIIAFSESDAYVGDPVRTYSSGMYLRLAFALVTHLDADVYFFDEVILVGDQSFKMKCAQKFQSLQAEDKTLILVSHDLINIQYYCNLALELNNGELVRAGHKDDVISGYLKRTAEHREETEEKQELPARFSLLDFRFEGGHAFGNEWRFAGDAPVRFIADYAVAEGPEPICVGLALSDPFNRYLCYEINPSDMHAPELRSGRHRATWTIPGNVLAEGSYYIDMAIFEGGALRANIPTIGRFAVKLAEKDVFRPPVFMPLQAFGTLFTEKLDAAQ